jgi:hypothetical protein
MPITIPTVTLTEAQTLLALRSFLAAALPEATPIVVGQDNRVPEPVGGSAQGGSAGGSGDFVTMTPIFAERIETNTDTYFDGYPSAPGTRTMKNPDKVTIQLDVHGPLSGDNQWTIITLFRSEWGVDQFTASGFDVTPLYTDEPAHQIPYLNGEGQIENRWVINCVLQCNPVVVVPQDFMAALAINLIEVDVVYPPH